MEELKCPYCGNTNVYLSNIGEGCYQIVCDTASEFIQDENGQYELVETYWEGCGRVIKRYDAEGNEI